MGTYCRICGYQGTSFKPLNKNFKGVLSWMYPHLDFKSDALQICQKCLSILKDHHEKAYSRRRDGRRPKASQWAKLVEITLNQRNTFTLNQRYY